MHATIRRYDGIDVARTEELTRRIDSGLVPKLSKLEGFKGYYLIEAGDGVMGSLGLFESAEQADESTRSPLPGCARRSWTRFFRIRPRSRPARSWRTRTASSAFNALRRFERRGRNGPLRSSDRLPSRSAESKRVRIVVGLGTSSESHLPQAPGPATFYRLQPLAGVHSVKGGAFF